MTERQQIAILRKALVDVVQKLGGMPGWRKVEGLVCPDSQGWWYHWQGQEPYPFVYSILCSLSFPERRYFVQFPDSRWCDEMKGTWLKVPVPEFPAAPSDSTPTLAETLQAICASALGDIEAQDAK